MKRIHSLQLQYIFLSVLVLLNVGLCHGSEFSRQQTGTSTIGIGSTSVTVTILPVCMTQSFLVFTATTDDLDAADFLIGGEMTDEVTLTFSRQGNTTTTATSIKWQVIEFDRGVSVQRGFSTLAGTTLAVPITAVDLSKSFVIATMTNSGAGFGATHGFNTDLTTTTNLQLNAAAGGPNFKVYWQVIEYQDASVQKISTTLTANNTNVTIPTPVTTAKTMLVGNHTITGAAKAQNMPKTELTSSTNIFYKKQNGPDLDFVTYVVEFTDATTVERGEINFAAGSISRTAGITAVASSVPFGPGNLGRQGSGNSGDTNMGYQYGTFEITNPTTLTITRALSGKGFLIPWEVVTFEDLNPESTIYYSLASGDWDNNNSWSLISDGSSGALAAGVWPSRNDNVVIRNGHTITIDATDDNNMCGIAPDDLNRTNVGAFLESNVNTFYHTGDIKVDAGGELSSSVSVMIEGYSYVNGNFNTTGTTDDIINLGMLEITSTATFDCGDDLILSGNSYTILDNVTTVEDDLYLDHTDAQLCGSGILNIGTGGADPIIQYLNGATDGQVCSSLTITCTTNCGGFSPPASPGSYSLGYTGPGGVGDQINNQLWLMADDLSLSNGAAVTSWADVSGNGLTAVSSGIPAEEPTFNTNTVNSTLPSISFDGGDFLNLGTPASLNFIPGTDSWSFFIVYNVPVLAQGTFFAKAYSVGGSRQYQYTIDDASGTSRFTSYIGGSSIVGSITSTGSWFVSSHTNNTANRDSWTNEGVNFATTIGTNIGNDLDVLIGARRQNNDNTGTGFPLTGSIAEIAMYNGEATTTERIIITNYLAAKYDITLTGNDVYDMDDNANGDFDFEVAGIGQASDGTFHKDAQGTGLVRINLASDLDDNEFLMWGHDGTAISLINTTDVDGAIIESRFDRVWRVSENDDTGTAVDVGTVRLTFDASAAPAFIIGSDLRLLISRDDPSFADNDVTPQAGSYNIDNQLVTFSNVDLQDGDYFTLGTVDNIDSPLPINLVSFTATAVNYLVELNWITASELNNDFFTIERSRDAIEWETVVQIKSIGTTSIKNKYSTIDDLPYFGISYYRLKQTDFDGTFTYSKIISVLLESTETLSIYPNPSRGSYTIKTGFELENVQISVIDMAGRLIPIKVAREKYWADINVEYSPPGIYILIINDGIQVFKQKILIDY